MDQVLAGKSVFLVIDAQVGDGAIPIVGYDAAVARMVELLSVARDCRIPIIHFQEIHRKDMVDFGRELDGVEAIRRIRKVAPSIRVIALTSFDGDEKVFPAIKAGAAGYLLKDAATNELLGAVRTLAGGGVLSQQFLKNDMAGAEQSAPSLTSALPPGQPGGRRPRQSSLPLVLWPRGAA